jgi:hypothetical protein
MGLVHILATALVMVLPWWNFPHSSKGTNFRYPFANSLPCMHSNINCFHKFSFKKWSLILTSLLVSETHCDIRALWIMCSCYLSNTLWHMDTVNYVQLLSNTLWHTHTVNYVQLLSNTLWIMCSCYLSNTLWHTHTVNYVQLLSI